MGASMIGFWILASLVAVVTVVVLARAMLVRHDQDAADYDMRIYRDQLRELERDLERGVVNPDEAERARVEISRRLLEADRKAQAEGAAGGAPRRATYGALAFTAAVIAGGGVMLYGGMGAPGYWDMPLKGRYEAAAETRATRPSQAEAEADVPPWPGPPAEAPADYVELVERLRATVAENPGDIEGQGLLANHEAALGNYPAAHAAKARVIVLKGDAATADDYAQYTDLLVMATEGYVSPEAETAAQEALSRDPDEPVALYYTGLLHAQTGRPDLTFEIWRKLLEASDPTDLWVPPIMAQIGQLAAVAGVDYTPPPLTPATTGPSAEDMANAAEMTPQERAEMIDGMVARLMDRLAEEGGSSREWAQLIGALAIQGNTDRARLILEEAQSVFADSPSDLAVLNAAAADAGLGAPAPADGAIPEGHADVVAETVSEMMNKLATQGGTAPEWARLIGALASQGDLERARAIWGEAQTVFAEHPPSLDAINAAAADAGLTDPVPYAAPAPARAPGADLSGPSADDMAAAAEMTDEKRAQMIASMVERLTDTLREEGGTPEKWEQLFNALKVMGDAERARSAWADAEAAFEGDPAALTYLRPGAKAAGAFE